jgi:N-formylglutamate deformylase
MRSLRFWANWDSRLTALIITQHSSGSVPFNILANMLGEAAHDVEAVRAHLDYLFHEGDPYTDALFYCPEASHVHALTSRFVVDLNRRRDEGGLNGVIKVTDFAGRPLYPEGFRFTEKRIEERLLRYYDPFHQTLDRMLSKPDIRFFIDAHAMAAVGPNIGPDAGRLRPAFSFITGGNPDGGPAREDETTSIPAGLVWRLAEHLQACFKDIIADSDVPRSILVNDPFARGGTQHRLSHPEHPHRTPGFALEINRNLYLQPGDNGLDVPVAGRIPLINMRMQQFIREITPLFA